MVVIREPIEFEWNKGNIGKNLGSHRVEDRESEESFFDEKRIIFKDRFHSAKEERFILLGKTKEKRLLYVVFTMRGKKVRIILARDISKVKEVRLYVKKT